ncbi:MAG TPA: PEP-CTERM sorting domain-containing protein [Phycisphaerae bacterium]|nr:PEP-CTERM sorting domain-containing protein [Phycisphaerae bacterium]
MKKFLMVAALVGMVAAPAFAGLAPEPASSTTLNTVSMNASLRSPAYAPNDAAHVYDGMTTEVAGPENLTYQVTQNPASGAFCNLIHLKPGATSISSIHIVLDQRPATAAWTWSIAFRNDVGGAAPIGSFLTTQSLGFSAWYVVGGMPFGGAGPTLFQFSLGAISANVGATTSIWACVQGTQPFRVRTGNVSGNEVNGNPGDGTPTSFYIGSGSGVYASSYGVGIGSASLMSSFTFAGGAGQVGNWHMALGGAPEPATAALLGLVGLVALRRRRA